MRALPKLFSFITLTAILAVTISAADDTVPKIDKSKLETYLRYAEGYSPKVKMSIDDPAPSPFKGYFRVLVHLSNGAQQVDRVYYATADGRRLVNGAIWDLSESPFLDTAEHLAFEGPSFGPANAKVRIVIFSDFECPYCREFAQTIRDNVPAKYPNDVRVVFKDFPIQHMHKWAQAAAEASHCVGDQKPEAFWAFHDWMFEHQQEVNESSVREKALAIAKGQNLDLSKVASCIDTHATAETVNRSLQAGQELQIQQTPTCFVNGRMLTGAVPWSALDAVIQLELNRPKDIPGSSSEKCCEVNIPTVIRK